jgi:hypothetical protein
MVVMLAVFAVFVGIVAGLAAVSPAAAGIAVLLLIVPAIWLSFMWALAIPALLFERLGPVAALRRSFRLVKGRWWKVAATLIVGVLLVTFLASIIQGVLLIVPALLADGNDVVLAFATVVAGTVGSVMSTPFTVAVAALVYFDQRVRKEGFDLELLAEGLGGELPAAAAGPPLLAPEVTPEQRAQAPFWPPPPGWTPPAPAEAEAPAEPPPGAPGPDDSPPAGTGGWAPPKAPQWPPPESPPRGSGGL